jgi:hypothetical protein
VSSLTDMWPHLSMLPRVCILCFSYWTWKGYNIRYQRSGDAGTPLLLVGTRGAATRPLRAPQGVRPRKAYLQPIFQGGPHVHAVVCDVAP